MKNKNRFLKNNSMPTWAIRLSVGVVYSVLIAIAVLAVHSNQHEKEFFFDTLFKKGEIIARVVEASARTPLPPEELTYTLQKIFEKITKVADISFIAITDLRGKIIYQSNSSKYENGSSIDINRFKPKGSHDLYAVSRPKSKNYKMLEFACLFSTPEAFKIESIASTNADHTVGRTSLSAINKGHTAPPTNILASTDQGQKNLIFIGLSMAEMERAISHNRIQLFILLLILFFFGIGIHIFWANRRGLHRSLHAFRDMKTFSSMLLARLPSGVIATDDDGRVKIYNEAAEAIITRKKEEIIDQKAQKVLPAALSGFVCRTQDSNEIIDREIAFRTPDRIIPLHVCSVPIQNGQGTLQSRVLLLHDLTEIKKLRGEVQRHERFVAMGKMAAGVAHEIRNPLNSIKGLATMLSSEFEEGSKKRDIAGLLGQEVDRLNRNISDLLEYSRPLYLKLGQEEINELIADILLIMESEFSAVGIQVSKNFNPDLPEINIDKDRIKQVLMNIFLNAVQAMDEGGSLTVNTRPASQRGQVEIIVQDTGCGIPEDDLERIFDPYFTTKATGTGLGLAMAYKIIQGHKGKFHISSQDEVGSTVRLVLGGNPALPKQK